MDCDIVKCDVIDYDVTECIECEYIELSKGENFYFFSQIQIGRNQIFFGEWVATNRIFMSPMPVRGLMLDFDYMYDRILTFAENVQGDTLILARDYILVNEEELFENVSYMITLYPSNDNFYIDLALTLSDIGLTEEIGNYFAYVRMRPENRTEHVFSGWFLVKDINTIIVAREEFLVIYERVSFGGDYGILHNWVPPIERPRGFVFPWE